MTFKVGDNFIINVDKINKDFNNGLKNFQSIVFVEVGKKYKITKINEFNVQFDIKVNQPQLIGKTWIKKANDLNFHIKVINKYLKGLV